MERWLPRQREEVPSSQKIQVRINFAPLNWTRQLPSSHQDVQTDSFWLLTLPATQLKSSRGILTRVTCPEGGAGGGGHRLLFIPKAAPGETRGFCGTPDAGFHSCNSVIGKLHPAEHS